MCPLRFILVFLSATIAGFFLLRNLKSEPEPLDFQTDNDAVSRPDNSSTSQSSDRSSKVRSAVESGFWTVVDMASGRYLWRLLASSSTSSKSSD